MVSDKTRREAFITQNLGWCMPAPGGSADGASNTMTFTVRAVWG
mgnify:FL=1